MPAYLVIDPQTGKLDGYYFDIDDATHVKESWERDLDRKLIIAELKSESQRLQKPALLSTLK